MLVEWMILIGKGGCLDSDGGPVHDFCLIDFGVDLFFCLGEDGGEEENKEDSFFHHTWNLSINYQN